MQTEVINIAEHRCQHSTTLTIHRYGTMLQNYASLCRTQVYCEDGEIPISNAGAENVIRPFCVGRKNWLFADTPRGARASAVFYSLIETAKLHSLEPYDYLCRLLTALPYAETVEQLEALLPWNIKVSQAV